MKNKMNKLETKSLSRGMEDMDEEDDDHEAEGMMRTLMDAHKIQGDSGKMGRVKKKAGRHMKILSKISEMGEAAEAVSKLPLREKLIKTYNEKFGPKKKK